MARAPTTSLTTSWGRLVPPPFASPSGTAANARALALAFPLRTLTWAMPSCPYNYYCGRADNRVVLICHRSTSCGGNCLTSGLTRDLLSMSRGTYSICHEACKNVCCPLRYILIFYQRALDILMSANHRVEWGCIKGQKKNSRRRVEGRVEIHN